MRAAAYDETLGKLVEHVLEVGHDQGVAVLPPPVPHDSVGQDDDVAVMLTTVDHYAPETVFADARHTPSLPALVTRALASHPGRVAAEESDLDFPEYSLSSLVHWFLKSARASRQIASQTRAPAGKPPTGMSLNALLSGRSRTLP